MGYYTDYRGNIRYEEPWNQRERERKDERRLRRKQQFDDMREQQQREIANIMASVQAYYTTEQGARPISPVRNAILPQSPRVTGLADDPDEAPERYVSKLEGLAKSLGLGAHTASCDCTCAQCIASRPKEAFPWDDIPDLKDEDRGWLKRMWATAELGPYTWVTTQNIR